MKKKNKASVYPPVIPNIEDWPIYKLSEDRTAFVEELNEHTLKRIQIRPTDVVSDLIAKTVYRERIRIKEEPWKVDPPDERQFWRKIRKYLVRDALDKDQEAAKAANEDILRRIIGRYSEEIVGTFKIKTFLFARKFLTLFFNRLLNTAAGRNLRRFWGSKYRLYDRLKVKGHTDSIRALMKKGTVVVVPTHSSNLDSILIGYAMDSILGLPSFSYGAGLNLYNTGYTAYYMNRLGAYRVDRRKKNPIYLETLKMMSNLSIQRGTNSLFFPGGTRERSGRLESKLKLGLLGTVVEAQRANCQKGKNEKIFVVPVILSYHFVLEAQFLIEQHLKRTGKEQYLQLRDASYSRRKIFKFIWKLFSQSSDLTLSFGKPLDVLGNFVDEEGVSYDRHGNVIDIEDYFRNSSGEILQDLQRESEYTHILANRIVDRYHKDNIVLSSHLVAYAVFNILLYSNNDLDIFGVLRLPREDYVFKIELVTQVVEQLRESLYDFESKGRIKLSEEIRWPIEKLIKHGVRNLGIFHVRKPLSFNKTGDIISEDFNLLYFYHNRLDNYKLKTAIRWQQPQSAFSAVTEDIL